MKKIAIISSLISIVSCGDSATTVEENKSLVGKWSFVKEEVVKSSTNETQPTEGNGCDEKNTYEFTENIYTETLFYLNGSGECQLVDNPYIRQYNFDKTNMKFWYVDLEDYPNYIKKLTDTELVYEHLNIDWDKDGKKDITRLYLVKTK